MAFIGPVRPTKKKAKASLLRNVRKPNVLERKVSSRRPTKTSRGSSSRKLIGPVRPPTAHTKKFIGPKKLPGGLKGAGIRIKNQLYRGTPTTLKGQLAEQKKGAEFVAAALPITGRVGGIVKGAVRGGQALKPIINRGGAIVRPAGFTEKLGRFAANVEEVKAITTSRFGTAVGNYAINEKNILLTKRLVEGAMKNKATALAATGLLVGAIGSYPFAGFIKEEALQTLGFATNSALRNGDYEGAQLAIDLTNEALEAEEGIKSKIPYANVLGKLDIFFSASKLKVSIDQAQLDDLKFKKENGLTDAEIFEMRKQERVDNDAQRTINFNAARLQTEELLRQAEVEQRNEDAAFWKKQKEQQRAADIKARDEDAKFWFEYMKAKLELQNKNAPSKLGFGLL